MADILSPPITITFLYLPDSTNLEPVSRPNKKPEQAAARSNPQAFLAPTLSQTILAVAGNIRSPVMVQQMIMSISVALIPRFFNNSFTAITAISDVALP